MAQNDENHEISNGCKAGSGGTFGNSGNPHPNNFDWTHQVSAKKRTAHQAGLESKDQLAHSAPLIAGPSHCDTWQKNRDTLDVSPNTCHSRALSCPATAAADGPMLEDDQEHGVGCVGREGVGLAPVKFLLKLKSLQPWMFTGLGSDEEEFRGGEGEGDCDDAETLMLGHSPRHSDSLSCHHTGPHPKSSCGWWMAQKAKETLGHHDSQAAYPDQTDRISNSESASSEGEESTSNPNPDDASTESWDYFAPDGDWAAGPPPSPPSASPSPSQEHTGSDEGGGGDPDAPHPPVGTGYFLAPAGTMSGSDDVLYALVSFPMHTRGFSNSRRTDLTD